jgi:hypothetical protein
MLYEENPNRVDFVNVRVGPERGFRLLVYGGFQPTRMHRKTPTQAQLHLARCVWVQTNPAKSGLPPLAARQDMPTCFRKHSPGWLTCI